MVAMEETRMRYGRAITVVLAAVLLVAVVAGIGWSAYNAGVAQGLAESGKLTLPAEGATVPVVPYYAPFGWFRPWGLYHPFGFGLLGCLIPLLVVFLLFGLFRFAFWGPRRYRWGGAWARGYKGWNPEQGDIPPAIRELHRKLHETDSGNPPPVPESS